MGGLMKILELGGNDFELMTKESLIHQVVRLQAEVRQLRDLNKTILSELKESKKRAYKS